MHLLQDTSMPFHQIFQTRTISSHISRYLLRRGYITITVNALKFFTYTSTTGALFVTQRHIQIDRMSFLYALLYQSSTSIAEGMLNIPRRLNCSNPCQSLRESGYVLHYFTISISFIYLYSNNMPIILCF